MAQCLRHLLSILFFFLLGLAHAVRVRDRSSLVLDPDQITSRGSVPGYVGQKKTQCASRTVDQGKLEGDLTHSCARRCSTHPRCQCFQVTATRCRIGLEASRATRVGPATAYLRDESAGDTGFCIADHTRKVDGSCTAFEICKEGRYVARACPSGLAFDTRLGQCAWPTAVPGCEVLAEADLPETHCGESSFLLAGSPSAAMQEWIRLRMDDWWRLIHGTRGIQARAEGRAAVSILRTTGIELTAASAEATTSRWALFSKDKEGALHMQAVAMVQQDGPEMNVMGIVSRRSLFKDGLSRGGTGKALLSAILGAAHRKHPNETVSLLGTPGDSYVEQLYRSFGMQEYGREETGMPKLRSDFPAECMDFITQTILCQEFDMSSAASIAISLVPGTGCLRRSCAHLIPRAQYWSQLKKMLLPF